MKQYVEVFTQDGDDWKTSISDQTTAAEAAEYFLGQQFNKGDDTQDRMVTVNRIIFHALDGKITEYSLNGEDEYDFFLSSKYEKFLKEKGIKLMDVGGVVAAVYIDTEEPIGYQFFNEASNSLPHIFTLYLEGHQTSALRCDAIPQIFRTFIREGKSNVKEADLE